MINPEFPYIPKDPDQKDEDNEAWSHLPNVKPQRYHCHYKILDGDCYGRSVECFYKQSVLMFKRGTTDEGVSLSQV